LSSIPDKKFLILEAEQYETKKALSDIGGWDVKCHNDDQSEILRCIRSWCVETVKMNKLDSCDEVEFQYSRFSTELTLKFLQTYREKYDDLTAQKFAKRQTDAMPIPEYISYIKEFLNE
jgi:hypothetical protein